MMANYNGCTFYMTPQKWPQWYVFEDNDCTGNIRGRHGRPGPQGQFTFNRVCGKDYYLICARAWPNWFIYMENDAKANVKSWCGAWSTGTLDYHRQMWWICSTFPCRVAKLVHIYGKQLWGQCQRRVWRPWSTGPLLSAKSVKITYPLHLCSMYDTTTNRSLSLYIL